MPSKKIQRTGELEKAIQKPIRPQVIRSRGLALTDRKTIEVANAEMMRSEAEAITTAVGEKLQLLLRRYELADNDWCCLALCLAIEHEPGFLVESQLVELGLGQQGTAGSGPVQFEAGKRPGRPEKWTAEMNSLLSAVHSARKRFQFETDLEALKHLAGHGKWAAPPNHRSERRSWIKTLQNRLTEAKREAKHLKRRVEEAERELAEAVRLIRNAK